MKSQITMKDIASHFGMSLHTIHKAINGKPGVSEATREKILDYASKNGYKLNSMASVLKKKEIQIAVCLPELEKDSRYFYSYIWQGYRSYLEEWEDLHLEVEEITYRKDSLSDTLIQLCKEWEQKKRPEGLLVSPPTDQKGKDAVNQLAASGICIVFVTGDCKECARLGAVQGDYLTAGKIMAEQMRNMLGDKKNILLLAGDTKKDSHADMVNGFLEYMNRVDSTCQVKVLSGYEDGECWKEQIGNALMKEVPDAIGCVFARGSAKLAAVLKEQFSDKKLPVIANDVFEENVEALKLGIFSNLIFKDPYRQAYLAMKMLCDFLIRDIKPEPDVLKVESVLVFESNLFYYWK